MERLIAWFSFIGAWLLVAGPIYQAALELQDQDIEEDRIRAAGENIIKPPEISTWWWILPPIKLILEGKRNREYRHAYIKALHPEDVEALVAFMNKATAWVFIALGGLLIAIKETFELTQRYRINSFLFLLIIMGLFVLSIYYTIYRIRRSERVISLKNER